MARKRVTSRRRKAAPARRKIKARKSATTRSTKATKSPKKGRKPAARPSSRVKATKVKAAKAAAPKVQTTKVRTTQAAPSVPEPPARPRHPPSLERARRQLTELEDNIPTPPSSLDLDRSPSAARSGRQSLREARLQHHETSPELTGGDVDASWEDAYAIGDEAPGGDNPTPDQDRVDDIGKALGVQYEDSEELKSSDKISERDKHRWELDPASAEDYPEHEE
jgi:Family of unknown function (DUF6335)